MGLRLKQLIMLHLRRNLNAFNRQPDVSMNLAYKGGAIFRIDFDLLSSLRKAFETLRA